MPTYNVPFGNVAGGGSSSPYQGAGSEVGFNINFLIGLVNAASVSAKNKMEILQARRSAISIADMFDMQMLMNHLSQLSEMSTSIVSAANTSVMSMARNVK